jgi:hypothetical protein
MYSQTISTSMGSWSKFPFLESDIMECLMEQGRVY